MEKSFFISKLKYMKLIAHRLGYQMTQYPENSLEVLQEIFGNEKLLNSCDGFEFDIHFTKDNVPIIIHDKYIDDISNCCGLVQNYTLAELKKFDFKTRTSLKKDTSITYKIATLEEILEFFENNIGLLKKRIIKIETKDYLFSSIKNISLKKIRILADILDKHQELSKNIIHLSFWPLNLYFLKRIQKNNSYIISKNDLLCDYNFMFFFSKFMSYLDYVSLRIKTNDLPIADKINSKRVNKKINFDLFWMKFSNALSEKNLKYLLNKYGIIHLYTLNSQKDIEELCKYISHDFFKENYKNFVITTNNPLNLKNQM